MALTKEETGIHLSYLDGWRGIAVLLVVFGHFWGDDHIWTGISSFGVDIFFVLSGRLMAEILFVRKSSISVFFVRRISRILPAFITFVIVTTLAFRGSELSHGMAAVAVALTMTLNYAMIYAHPIGLFDHLWSLCVEEHAYIILAGVAFCSRRRTFRVGLVVALVGFAALINGVIRLDLLGNGMLVTRWRSDVSVAGIFIAAAFWLRFKSISLTSLMSPLALAVAVICRFQDEASLYFGVSTIALAIAVVKLDDSLTMFRRMLSFAPLKTLGLWSFSLYLWQQPFYKLHRLDDWSLLMTLSCTFICALISFYIIERPTRRLINARFDEVRQRQACEVAGALP
jgi:peptidoglycan/LPS O-acetylase OafA/YrhL